MPKEPDAIVSVVELEFDFELFLVKGWKRPTDYSWIVCC